MSCNIIADIAGQYKTLLALLDKMPEGEPISLGDMCCRGPHSKEVFEYFKKNGRAVMGNHEHMLLDVTRSEHQAYGMYLFTHERNGGNKTLESLIGEDWEKYQRPSADLWTDGTFNGNFTCEVQPELLDWVEALPHTILIDNLILTHAPIYDDGNQEKFTKPPPWRFGDVKSGNHINHQSLIWNRWEPSEIKDRVQIFGHCSSWGLKYFGPTDKPWAICLDASRDKILTGMHYPSMKIYQQEFID